ncbi:MULTISPECIES: leucyl aminopeptidase [unclassified Aureimonas]|uniref:leucyl aminopeptidase n=1 Tax=unclassified Aureimonas TaxID=2615206 RepID=UPI0006FCC7F5|nr:MULTISPECIES: leucyl aminopeptidase [unclassified Aureimonas]KQT52932.1 aminopeptidase [Aureimonas sp. Leaf427]KQT80391.1 aminopeptidase [Aureimonas sp. Leaf460]
MSIKPTISFAGLTAPAGGVLAVFAGEGASLAASVPQPVAAAVARGAGIAKFKGKSLVTLDFLAPAGSDLDRVIVVGTKADKPYGEEDWLKVGGTIAAKTKGAEAITIWCEGPQGAIGAADTAAIAAGVVLRAYNFDLYKSKKAKKNGEDEDAGKDAPASVTIAVADPEAARAAFALHEAVAEGVILARDLVNEPANVLGPVEFAARIEALSEVGVEVEILDEKQMAELKMFALLGVAQGSPRPGRMAIMRWNGGAEGEAPVAFVGKGVVFDTGGISIKPAASMDEMKGDMGGAAAVTGLMRALAGRKAKVNVVGIVGLVENSVDGLAQRPGDIVTAMSGTTIEVLNTDAEGRLVLADALWYCQDRFKPRFMVNLATLTGAIIVALGSHYAGLFSNDDELSEKLHAAGTATGEKVWRLPLGPEYDKMIEGKFADIKNIGSGRSAGSITAAQFLQRFVNDVPWAHLDIAGTAMGSPANEYNQSWASGFGVRLLNQLVAANYEAS